MRKALGFTVTVCVTGLSLLAACACAADAGQPPKPELDKPVLKDGEILVSGTFVWSGKPKETHDIYAVLKPKAANEWTATYTFKWGKNNMTYLGAMKGDLKNGVLTGEGAPKDKSRTFVFEGTAKNGSVDFKGIETTGGKRVNQATGTFKTR